MSNVFVVCDADESIPFPFLHDQGCLMPTKQDLLEILSAVQASLAIPDQEYEKYRNWLFCEAHLDSYGLEQISEYGFILSPEQREKALKNEQLRREQYKQPKAAAACIYVMQSLVTGEVKIGRSVNPFNRVKSVQASQPHEVKLVLVSGPVEKPSKREKELHDLFASYRLRGEWFAPEALEGLMQAKLDGEVFFREVA